jgi:hypothetical protein
MKWPPSSLRQRLIAAHLIPVSIETLTLIVWSATTTKLFGSAELQPMNVQLDKFSEYEPGAKETWTTPDASHPLETELIGHVIT